MHEVFYFFFDHQQEPFYSDTLFQCYNGTMLQKRQTHGIPPLKIDFHRILSAANHKPFISLFPSILIDNPYYIYTGCKVTDLEVVAYHILILFHCSSCHISNQHIITGIQLPENNGS